MTTDDLMKVALDLAGMTEVPGDSAIHVPGNKISKILIGIDIGTTELLLARQLKVDCVIAHHPPGGTARIDFHKVIWGHYDQMTTAGVSPEVAKTVVKKKVKRAKLRAHTQNWDHVPSVARLLNMPFINIHQPLDEIGRLGMDKAVQKTLMNHPGATLREIVEGLNILPEFSKSLTKIAIRLGSPENKAGRVVVSHGAGTSGGAAVARAYFESGKVDTVIYIHIDPGELTKLEKEGSGNLIVTGHIASDSVGINPYIKELENRGIETLVISGIVR